MCVCVCVCVREGKRERERASVCACVHACVCSVLFPICTAAITGKVMYKHYHGLLGFVSDMEFPIFFELHECTSIMYCYSLFKVLATVYCNIDKGGNHILGEVGNSDVPCILVQSLCHLAYN